MMAVRWYRAVGFIHVSLMANTVHIGVTVCPIMAKTEVSVFVVLFLMHSFHVRFFMFGDELATVFENYW